MSDRHANNYQEIVQIESEPESGVEPPLVGVVFEIRIGLGWVGFGFGLLPRLGAG